MLEKNLYIEIDRPNYTPIYSVQYDYNSRFYNITILNQSQPLDLTGLRVVVAGKKPDGEDVFNSCKILDAKKGQVQLELTEQMNAVTGVSEYALEIFSSNGMLSSQPFQLKITKSTISKDVASSSELSALQNALNEVQDIDNRFAQTNAQLSTKADKDIVRLKNENIDLDDMSERTLQAIQGGEGTSFELLSIPRDRSVTPEKTSFYKKGKNLFNKQTAIDGKFVNQVYGTLSDGENYCCSEYISIEAIEYIFNDSGYGGDRYALYDVNKTFLQGGLGRSIPKVENAKYIRFSFNKVAKDIMQLEAGTVCTSYEEYSYKIPFKEIEEHSHNINDLDGQITEDKTIFFDKTINLVDKTRCESGFISASNGNEYAHDSYWRTPHIAVEEGVYTFLGGLTLTHSACYDTNGKFICPVSRFKTSGKTFNITDPTIKTIRLTVLNQSSLDTMFLYKGNEEKEYQPYGYYLKDIYIKPGVAEKIIINLPSKLYALVDEEFNIYYDNILEGRDTDYIIDVDCSVGMQMERCYRLVPTEKGEVNITIKVYDNDMNLVGNKTSKIIVSSKSQGSGVTRKIIILGDSTTNNGICVTKLNQNFTDDVMNIVTLGTRGIAPNNHEGRSGWKFALYFNVYEDSGAPGVFNAFYNPTTQTFDYQYYCENSGIDIPDYFFINLGINDTFSFSTDANLYNEIEKLLIMSDEMIKQIHEMSSDIKIGMVLTIPPNYSQDAFGKAYGCNQYRDRYKRNNILWVNELIKKYDNRESENIYLVPMHCNLDTKYNFGLEEIQVNKRNPITYLSPITNGGVHPVESGYWQCADTYWYFLKAQES